MGPPAESLDILNQRNRATQARQLAERAQGAGSRILMALSDPLHAPRNVMLAVIAYVLVWTSYAIVSTSLHDLHPDMTEEAVIARDWAFGYLKHPPMSVWVPGVWFTIFPPRAWAFYLLAMSTAGVGLFSAWLLARRYLSIEKAAIALALLTFVPFYNFHAIRFNANSLQVALWPVAMLFFLRSLERQKIFDAVVAGILTAAALLTKYWAAFLILGFFAAACVHPRRSRYFRSVAPWVSALVAISLVAPHVHWLQAHDFWPLRYAGARASVDQNRFLLVTKYVAASFAYVAVAIALAWWVKGAEGRPFRRTFSALSAEERSLAVLLLIPVLSPIALTLASGANLNALWGMPAFALLPVVLLSPAGAPLVAWRAATIVFAAVLAPFVFAFMSPIAATAQAWARPDPVNMLALTDAVAAAWASQSKPLRIVAGPEDFAFSTAFPLRTRPSAFPNQSYVWAPYLTEERVKREGMAIVCPAQHQHCVAGARERASITPGARTSEISVEGGSFVRRIPPQPFLITIIPPGSE
jgi:4-amino-4-deoxy-L-arabinose transferase-like glycosyltransferase